MEKPKDFYSKNVADAIRQACDAFATSQEKLDIEVVETGSAGIFGLCRKRAHIRVKRKEAEPQVKKGRKEKAVSPAAESVPEEVSAPAREMAAEKPASEPKKGGKKKSPKEAKITESKPVQEKEEEPMEPPSESVLNGVRDNLENILKLMGFPSEITVTFDGSSIQCQVKGEHEEAVAGQDGRTLDSLQYLLRKMFSRDIPDRMMIDLNVGDFRERRIEELQKTAVELAEKVKADGKTQAIPALNPSERRIVHVALQDDKGVRSRSVGEGLFKKVLIYKPGSRTRKPGGRGRGRQSGGAADK